MVYVAKHGATRQPNLKIAVIGHVEMAEFAVVDHVPEQGDIIHANDCREVPAGGAAAAAVQIAKLNYGCLFLTAVGNDVRGVQVKPGLEAMGLTVEAAVRKSSQRRAFVYLDAEGERTITTIGERAHPELDDPLGWDQLESADAVYVTAAGPDVLNAARAAKQVVATVRVGNALADAGIKVDALVASANDRGEQYLRGSIEPSPTWVIRTDGSRGGTLEAEDGTVTDWSTIDPPGPKADSYGAGDSFAGGVTYGLARGFAIEKAIRIGVICGAHAVTGHGPYEGQATAKDIEDWERTIGS